MKILIVKNPEYEEIVMDFTDFERSIESNLTNWQISFNITQTNTNAFVFNLLQSDQASLLFEGQEYVIQQINPVLSGNTQTISVTATHIYYDVQKKIRLEDTIDSDYEDDSRPKHTLEEYLSYLYKGNTYGYSYEIKGAFTARKLIPEFGKSDAGDTDATTKKYTDAEAVKHLQDVPEATFTLNYYGSRLPAIGEVWMAIIEPMGLDVDVTIVGVKDYPFDDTKPAELTFSNARKDMLSIQQQISKKATTAYNKSHFATELISSVQNVAVNAWDARVVIEKVGEVND
ncbi:prophage endopeptidase tail family protein [Bacillus subtilis]